MPPPAAPSRFLILGDSNGNGYYPDPNDNAALPAGWVVRSAGANLATWPVGTTPNCCGTMPYLISGTSAPGGWIIRRSGNGANTGAATVDPQIAGALADVAALADGTPDVVIFYFGANDVSEAESAVYPANMRRMAAQVRWRWPSAHFVYLGEATSEGGPGQTWERLAANRAALAELAADPYLGGSYVDGSALDLGDSIHWNAAGHAALGALISDLWSPP